MAGFFKSLINKISNRADIDWDDLEASLIAADLGVHLTTYIIDDLRDLGRKVTVDDVVETTRRHLSDKLPPDFPRLCSREIVNKLADLITMSSFLVRLFQNTPLIMSSLKLRMTPMGDFERQRGQISVG